MNQFSIRQLSADDWVEYSRLRLEALAKHPAYFSPSSDETKFTETDWRNRLSNPHGANFGLFDGKKMIGLTGVFREGNDPNAKKAVLVSSYIQAAYRKQGLSKLFYEARIAWAKDQKDIHTLVLEHRDDNLPSQKAHQKFGFKFQDSVVELWPDGERRPSLIYVLEL